MTNQPTPTTIPAAEPECWEDEPCWDCTTMGNLQCGPTTTVATVAPAPQMLPETGAVAAYGAGLIGTVCILFGIGLRWVAS